MIDSEIRKDIMIMYIAIRTALFDGEYNPLVDSILKKYEIELDEGDYVIDKD